MVNIDLKKAYDIVDEKDDKRLHSKIYFNSNEPLEDLFRNFSVKGKDVLSVMGSGDQPFFCYYNGAKSVDTFDINPLSVYYYYLRYWSILYNNQFYPDRSILHSHQYIYDLLKKVQCESREEKLAYRFWSEFIRNAFPFTCYNLYYVGGSENKVRDLDLLKEKIKGKRVHFSCFDLFEEVPKEKKYDIIITSNILEYAGEGMKLVKTRNNLKSLLNEDGMIIASHYCLDRDSVHFSTERKTFSQCFDYKEFPSKYHAFAKVDSPIGYSYTLKRC